MFPSDLLSDEVTLLPVRSLTWKVKATESNLGVLFRDKSLKIHSCFKQFYYEISVCVFVLWFCFVYGFCHANCMSFCFGLAVTMPLQFLRIARKREGMGKGTGTTKQCSEI